MSDLATIPPPAVEAAQAQTPNTAPPPSMGPVGSFGGSAVPTPTIATPTKVTFATNAAPKLDPQTVLAAAHSAQDPVQAAAHAELTGAFSAISHIVDQLHQLPARGQLAVWNWASPYYRDLLASGGFKPPEIPTPDHSGGFFGDLWHSVAHVADVARHGVATGADVAVVGPAKATAHDILTGMNYGTSGVLHATRAFAYNELTPHGSGDYWGQLAGLVSPNDWLKAWHASEHGASSFQPQVIRELSTQLSPLELKVATMAASGANAKQILQLDPLKHAEITSFMNSHEGQQAISTLSSAKLDLGSVVFGPGWSNPLHPTHTLANPDFNPMVNLGPIHGHPLSGLLDATVDWYSTPLVMASKLRLLTNTEKFALLDGAGNARDVRVLYQSEPAVKRWADKMAQTLTSTGDTPNIQGVMRMQSSIAPLADDLVAAFPKIKEAMAAGRGGEELTNVMADNQAMFNILRGRAGLAFNKATLFPHLTHAQSAALALRVGLPDLLKRAEGLDIGILSPRQWFQKVFGDGATQSAVADAERWRDTGAAARFARRAKTLTNERSWIDLSSPDRGRDVQRLAAMYLPESKISHFVNAFMSIPVTEEGRQRVVLKGLIHDLFLAAGMDESASGREWLQKWEQQLRGESGNERYSFGRNAWYANPYADNGSGREVALLPSQLSGAVSIPDFREVYKLAKKSWVAEQLGGVIPTEAIDYAMERIWKPFTLDRPGFGLRVSGDEVFNKALRDGAWNLLASRAGASLYKIESPALHNAKTITRLWDALTSHIPGAVKDGINRMSPSEIKAHIFGWRAIQAAASKVLPSDILEASKWLAENGRWDGPLAESIDALTQHMGGYVDDEHGWNQGVKLWGSAEPITFRPTGGMQDYSPLDPDAYPAYHYALTGIAMDEPGREAARVLGEHSPPPGVGNAQALTGPATDEQTAAVVRWAEDPKNEAITKRMQALQQTPDGRPLDTGEASKAEAIRAWADKVVEHVNHYLTDHEGNLLRMHDGTPLAQLVAKDPLKMENGHWQYALPSTEELTQIPREKLPDEITARRLMPHVETNMQRFINKTMQETVGRPVNYISRMPIYLSNFARAFKEARAFHASRDIEDVGNKLAGDIATERAWRETMPYIHNPRLRSQLSVMGRNIAPFWFASEQFYKRWAKVFLQHPEALRKVQLLMNGLRTVGFLHKDSYGNDSFYYPGSGWVIGALQKAFPGTGIPVPNSFTGEVGGLNPSFTHGGWPSPSLGPFATIPLSILASHFPSLDPLVRQLEGVPGSAPPGIIGQFTPTVLTRFIQAMSASPEGSSMMHTAIIQASQYLDATGHGPPQNATPAEMDVFQARIETWAKDMMFIRAILGLAAPATPAFNIADLGIPEALHTLMKEMPVHEAVAKLVQRYPNGLPYTVSGSTATGIGQSGAYVPSTKGAIDFIKAHLPFFKSYPAAAPWFFPLTTQNGPFDDQAYQTTLALGLRSERTLSQWWTQVRFAEGANVYFPHEAKVKAAITAYPQYKEQLTHNWDVWKDAYEKTHPVFAAQLNDPQATNRRNVVIQQIQQALKDSALPDSPESQHVAFLMAGFQKVWDFYQATQGESSYDTQHADNKKAFLAWGDGVAKAFPDVAPFWNGVLSKGVPG